ncbi:sensor histidine kinase [Stratiformator vulcanicus]|nr:HAMP domain-containing sensor histidine kinase [Stratiformator vulcanicus]
MNAPLSTSGPARSSRGVGMRRLEDASIEQTAEFETFIRELLHDLRAPVRSVLGFSDALLADHGSSLNPAAADYVTRMIAAAERMERSLAAVREFIEAARINPKLEPVDCETIVRDAVSRFCVAEEVDPDQIVIESQSVVVIADRRTLSAALRPLLRNAVHFVAAEKVARIRIHFQKRDDVVRICVDDGGIGIPDEEAARIFEPFERLHGEEHFAGSGLGLATSRRAIGQLGGAAGYESISGGSRFWLELQIADGHDFSRSEMRSTSESATIASEDESAGSTANETDRGV